MDKIYLLNKQEVKIGDQISVGSLKLTLTEQLIKDCPELFEVKSTTNKLDEAIKRYPIGVKVVDLITSKTMEIRSHNYTYDLSYQSPNQEIWLIAKERGYRKRKGICVFKDGQWAKISKPILVTEDGVELYQGDTYCFISEYKKKFSIITNSECVILEGDISESFSPDLKIFSSIKAAEEWVEKNKPKEKTLEDYENLLLNLDENDDRIESKAYLSCGNSSYIKAHFFNIMRVHEPKLYWTKVLQLIADDLNGNWEPNYSNIGNMYCNLYTINFDMGKYDTDSFRSSNTGKVYFKGKREGNRAIELMGDKLDVIYKQ